MTRVLPTSAAEISPDWLTDVLRQAGFSGLVVRTADLTRIGQNQSFTGGGLYRIGLTFDGPAGKAPESLVAKLSPSDPEQAARFHAANHREVAFYTTLAGQYDLPTPRCYFGRVDAARQASLLLLQDLGDARSVPFAAGLCETDAAAVVDALARVHSTWWNSPQLDGFDGMALLDEFGFSACWGRYRDKVATLLGNVDIPASFFALGDHLAAHWPRIFGDLLARGPVTALHRDVQADNVMFDATGQAVLLDWQIMGQGRGAYDVAYALISSLTPQLRRRAERGLVARYHRALVDAGVADYAIDDCWQDYLRAVVGKVFLTVVATVIFEHGSDHKIAWRRVDLERLLAFCADHEISAQTFA
jgi:Phosphotransferase enzyme family